MLRGQIQKIKPEKVIFWKPSKKIYSYHIYKSDVNEYMDFVKMDG